MGNLRGSEYTFTNNFIYRSIYHIEVARMNDYYLVRSHREGGAYSYLYPAGSGDLRPVVDALVADAAELGVPFHMNGVPREGTRRAGGPLSRAVCLLGDARQLRLPLRE